MLVWLFNPTKLVGKSPKLTIFWEEEPYKIMEILNDVTMRIRKESSGKYKVVHVDRLKAVEIRTHKENENASTGTKGTDMDLGFLEEEETIGETLEKMEETGRETVSPRGDGFDHQETD